MRLFLGVVGQILRQASPGSFGIFMDLAKGRSPQPVFASCRNGTAFRGSSRGRVVLDVSQGHSPGCCWSSVDGICCYLQLVLLLVVGPAPRGRSRSSRSVPLLAVGPAPRGRARSSRSGPLLAVGPAPRGRSRSSRSVPLLAVGPAPRGRSRSSRSVPLLGLHSPAGFSR